MELGIFAKTFAAAPLADILDRVVENGFTAVHFNMACVGLPSMPDEISPTRAAQIGAEMAARGLKMAGISGTYNMIHPDPARRAEGLRRLAVIAAACPAMGTKLISLCTGTRDPDDQWRHHRDNGRPEAWADLTAEMEKALAIAGEYDLTLGIEPEISNVVDSAVKAQRLLAEMGTERLKIIIDPANLFPAGTLPDQHRIMDEAFGRLGADMVMAHAKDIAHDGEAGDRAAGTGKLDFGYYIGKLREIGFEGALVMHGLTAEEVPQSVQYLRQWL
jgi:sugar phosphate isomerase/epimerase